MNSLSRDAQYGLIMKVAPLNLYYGWFVFNFVMNSLFKTIALIGKYKNPEIMAPLLRLGKFLESRNLIVVLDSLTASNISEKNFEEISSTINLADTFYKNSFYSIKDIPVSFRFSILVARRVYRKIGHKILKKKNFENYQNSGKIYVSNTEKVLETFLSIFDLIKLSFNNKKNDQINLDHDFINEEINLVKSSIETNKLFIGEFKK